MSTRVGKRGCHVSQQNLGQRLMNRAEFDLLSMSVNSTTEKGLLIINTLASGNLAMLDIKLYNLRPYTHGLYALTQALN